MELLIGLAVGLWWAHHRIKKFREQMIVTVIVDERMQADQG